LSTGEGGKLIDWRRRANFTLLRQTVTVIFFRALCKKVFAPETGENTRRY
jgi:hypothetical protein